MSKSNKISSKQRVEELENEFNDFGQFCAKKLKIEPSRLYQEFKDFLKEELETKKKKLLGGN